MYRRVVGGRRAASHPYKQPNAECQDDYCQRNGNGERDQRCLVPGESQSPLTLWARLYLDVILLAGAGLVTLCIPEAIYPIVAAGCLEVMPTPLPDGGSGVLRSDGLDVLRERLRTADSLVIGPGLGRSPETVDALLDVLQNLVCPAVVDADGLNIAAAAEFDWRHCGQPVVLTPHPAEMARLAQLETAIVQDDREGVATRYAHERGAIVVLKGAKTVIAAPDGRVHTDAHSVVALATGGTGDVLAGLVGSFIAQRLDPFDAAVAAVTAHAHAGLLVQTRRGRAGALASDLLRALPRAQEQLRRALEAG